MSKMISTTLEKICLPEKGVPVIRGNNLSLSYDKFYDIGFVYVTKKKAEELRCYAYRGDLIFTAAGTLGQVDIISEDSLYDEYVISNKQIRARIDENKVDSLYAYYWFTSPWIKDVLMRSNKGSTVPLLTLSEVKVLLITYPEHIEEQRKIVYCLEQISKKYKTTIG